MALDIASEIWRMSLHPESTISLKIFVRSRNVGSFEIYKNARFVRIDKIRIDCTGSDWYAILKTICRSLLRGAISSVEHLDYAIVTVGVSSGFYESAVLQVRGGLFDVPEVLIEFAAAACDPRLKIESSSIEGNKMESLKVKLFNEDAKAPSRGSLHAAGYDLYASVDATVEPNSTAIVDTGVGVAVPLGTYGRIAPRSGVSTKGVMVNAGVVDEDYRGELRVVLHNMKNEPYEIKKGDRIAQLIIQCIKTPQVDIVDELSNTERGDNGFGSTGR